MDNYLSPEEIEEFIRLFLHKKWLANKMQNRELRQLAQRVHNALAHLGRTTNIDMLFEAFRKLSYHIAVVEPYDFQITEKPYIMTNAHRIFIGVEHENLLTLEAKMKHFLIGRWSSLSKSQKDFLKILMSDNT